jgi:hypothetical protein
VEKATFGACPTCEIEHSAEAQSTRGAMPEHVKGWQRWREQLASGEMSSHELRERTPNLCPMCQDLVGGVALDAADDEMIAWLDQQIQHHRETGTAAAPERRQEKQS